jgi:hypothetical protein
LKKWILVLQLLLLAISKAIAQENPKIKWELDGYLETYYSFDSNQPIGNNRDDWFVSYRRHNEFSINLALLRIKASTENMRVAFGAMAGTYAQHNLAHEPSGLKNIYEANVGVALNKKRNLWLEAGVFESYIGFENPIGMDCITATRGLSSEGSPYYVSGARLQYEPKGRWNLSLYAMNGWQQLQNLGNSGPALGTHIVFKPKERLVYNWNTFLGPPAGDAGIQWFFNNFFVQWQAHKRLSITTSWDVGLQQNHHTKTALIWQATNLIGKIQLAQKHHLGWRLEYFHDPNNVVMSTAESTAFQVFGYSINYDFAPSAQTLVRLEYRHLQNKRPVFMAASGLESQKTSLTAILAVKF